MTWLTRERVMELGETDRYYGDSRWRFYVTAMDILRDHLWKPIDRLRVLEVGPRSAPFWSESTVVEMEPRPALLESHEGNVIRGRVDDLDEMNVLPDQEYDLTIACQVFEHLANPTVAWQVIKRVTRSVCFLTFPWRWDPKHVGHDRDMRDLASWTHGDLPDWVRKVGSCRVGAWFSFD